MRYWNMRFAQAKYSDQHLAETNKLGQSTEVLGSDYGYLRLSQRPTLNNPKGRLTCVDLFSGCGGMALGVKEACQERGIALNVPFAIDSAQAAVNVFEDNFSDASIINGNIQNYFSDSVDSPVTKEELELASRLGDVDFLIGGPPCQGHSDLNNYTRRRDAKNALYLYMARAAKVLRPRCVIVENVQGISHDKNLVLQRTIESLVSQGYEVDSGLVELPEIGVPQRRRRHILIATLNMACPSLSKIISESKIREVRDVGWAFGDLGEPNKLSLADTPSTPSKDNSTRIDYLFENDLFDLPNEQRPPCHRDKRQTYNSVYGRLSWDKPSQTITSGFYSMCMGRYVHPSQRRTLTAHEAARLQFFPDFFSFEKARSRTAIATLVGNAVPMKLSYVISRSLLNSVAEHGGY